jgi:hypothetical protein
MPIFTALALIGSGEDSTDWTACADPWRCYIKNAGKSGQGPPVRFLSSVVQQRITREPACLMLYVRGQESMGHGWEPGLAFDCDYKVVPSIN